MFYCANYLAGVSVHNLGTILNLVPYRYEHYVDCVRSTTDHIVFSINLFKGCLDPMTKF